MTPCDNRKTELQLFWFVFIYLVVFNIHEKKTTKTRVGIKRIVRDGKCAIFFVCFIIVDSQ